MFRRGAHYLSRALSGSPGETPVALVRRADEANRRKDWSAARDLYRRALDQRPEWDHIWVQYGHSLKESGDAQGAITAYATAISLSPDVADTHLQLGHARKLVGDLDGALESYRRACVLEPGLDDARREVEALVDLVGVAAAGPERGLAATEFDAAFYVSAFPDGAAPVDPLGHYLKEGWREGRDPTGWFSTRYYLARNPDVAEAGINPFWHFLAHGRAEGRRPAAGADAGAAFAARAAALAPGPHYEAPDPRIGGDRPAKAKILAYYLPQFHPIPENDRWWGEGFTEWRNVVRGQPRFAGHVQPRAPRELGFYDLRQDDVMPRQIALAKAAGLFGFCYYYYWFNGRRLLEAPTERMLADPDLDFPFCLMWANENWTRTWDGLERDVLMSQDYRDSDDAALIDDLARHFVDPRYIRVAGRPLFFLYRPGNVPDAAETIARWRALFRERHGLEPFILMAQGFGDVDPRPFGLDGAIEFPPHKLCQGMEDINASVEILDPAFEGRVLDYDAVIRRARDEAPPPYPLIRTVAPSWDNEARRPGRGTTIHGSTPAKFEGWLRESIAFARANRFEGEAFVAVNAWNEWAEGAYLEPDIHYGGAYLNAVARAVHGVPARMRGRRPQILIVGHDAYRHGAQMLALNITRTLIRQFGMDVTVMLGEGGPLLDDYRALAETHVVPFADQESVAATAALAAAAGATHAVVNTTVAGATVAALKTAGLTVTCLIHELGRLRAAYDLAPQAETIARHAEDVVFPAEIVRDSFVETASPPQGAARIRPQGLYRADLLDRPRADDGVRAALGLPERARLVINVGYADLRKGFDRFVAIARATCAARDDVWFLWVGDAAPEVTLWHLPEAARIGDGGRCRLIGHVEDVAPWFAAADAFLLTSREDPFPSVALEALAAGLPVIGHEGAGGMDALIREHGRLLPGDDPADAAAALLETLDAPPGPAEEAGRRRREAIRRDYRFDQYCSDVASGFGAHFKTVSVVAVSLNDTHHLHERLTSIFDQDYPVLEILVLDDASTDDSLAAIRAAAEAAERDIQLIVNETNSGSPFRQWRKGLAAARGDYVWIAEADDVAAPEFLGALATAMARADAALGFCDSWQIDEAGERLGDSYKPYINAIEPGAFAESFEMAGLEFLKRFLSVKNVLLNVSGALFRRDALIAAMAAAGDELEGYRVAGDWRLYTEICAAGGGVAFEARALNGHRRHRASVTHALAAQRHYDEIAGMQAFAADRVALDDAARAARDRHLAEVREVLGLTKTTAEA